MKSTLEAEWSVILEKYRLKLDSAKLAEREISNWLDDDVVDTGSITRWIDTFEAVATGNRQSGHLGNGNAHRIFATPNLILIQCIYPDRSGEVVLLTKAQIIDILHKFDAFLTQRLENHPNPPKGFELEYEAEGKAAYEQYVEKGGILDTVSPDKDGYREKLGPHTFFPTHWSKEQAEEEIMAAFFETKVMVNQSKWEGRCPSGVRVKGYIETTPEGTTEVVACWPIYSGD